jgi:hypothetical protein
MADKTPPDPSAAFHEWVTQWERNFDSFANQVMGTEGFSQAMNEAQKSQLNAQRMFAETMSQLLISMNIPTRDDMLRLGEGMAAIERRLESIETKIGAGLKTKEAKKKRPARTKKPAASKENDK